VTEIRTFSFCDLSQICDAGSYCPAGCAALKPCPLGVIAVSAGTQHSVALAAFCVMSAHHLTRHADLDIRVVVLVAESAVCTFCPNGTTAQSSTQCTACPPGQQCLLGGNINAPLDMVALFGAQYTRAPTTSWQSVNSSKSLITVLQNESTAEFALLQQTLGIVIAVLVLLGVLVAVYIRYYNVHGGKFIALDLLFRLSHFTPAGQQVTAYKSCVGVVFTFTTAAVAVLAGYLLVHQSTFLFAPTSTLSTGELPFEPVGAYTLSVVVVGFGLQSSCSNFAAQSGGDFTLTFAPLNSIVGMCGSRVESSGCIINCLALCLMASDHL
jgi:hypothetical protein